MNGVNKNFSARWLRNMDWSLRGVGGSRMHHLSSEILRSIDKSIRAFIHTGSGIVRKFPVGRVKDMERRGWSR